MDDLTLLAISLRRLIEAISLEARTRNTWVSTLSFTSDDFTERAIRDGQISLWELLGVIVHARAMEIVSDTLALAMWLAPRAIDAANRWGRDKPRWIDPICFAKSDRKSVPFLLSEFSMHVGQVLKTARDVCAEFYARLPGAKWSGQEIGLEKWSAVQALKVLILLERAKSVIGASLRPAKSLLNKVLLLGAPFPLVGMLDVLLDVFFCG